MKLPEELPFAILPGIPNDDRPFVKMPEEFIEAIVRHCAKVCKDSVSKGRLWPEKDILSDFSLEDKPCA